MRLRRLELAIIALTLAFVCFVGGYLTGRSRGVVSISPAVEAQRDGQVEPVLQVGAAAAPKSEAAHQSPIATEAAPQLPQPQPPQLPQAEQIIVPEPVPQAAFDALGRININTASQSELMDLPGIGEALSLRILDYRNAHGPFRRIEELRNVSGIGEKRFEAIMDKVTIGQ
ncbi:MAG: ComEA family DNA-binding protein [Oscillospiraceae bacterium]|nr:ComEA family DNA-binding protein [Oscillospiraceae bacterium]